MKRKAHTFLNTAFNAGNTALDMARLYKKRKGSSSSMKKKPAARMAYGKKYKTSGFTTTQHDVRSSSKKKYNKVKVRKQKAFASKIQRALAPRQELNVYSETFSAVPRTSFITQNENIRGQITDDSNMMLNTGKLFSTNQNTGYIMGRFQNIGGSSDTTVNKGAKSLIPNNEFGLRVHGSRMQISIKTLSLANQPNLYDVYEFVAAKDIPASEALYSTPLSAWNQCLIDAYDPIDGGSITPTSTKNGLTPYDCPGLGKYWIILKKTRIYLALNTVAEFDVVGKPFTLKGDKFQNNYAIAGITKGVLVLGGIGDNADWTVSATVMRTTAQKSWHFKYNAGQSELPQRPTVLHKDL